MQEFPTTFKCYITFIVDPRVSNISIEGTRMCTLHLQMLKDMMQKISKLPSLFIVKWSIQKIVCTMHFVLDFLKVLANANKSMN